MSKKTEIKPKHEDLELDDLISRVERLSLLPTIVLSSILVSERNSKFELGKRPGLINNIK